MGNIEGRSLSLSIRCYRGLLRAYPQAFLAEFEDLLCQAFGDLAHRAVRSNGSWGLIVLWVHTIPDLISSALSQRFRTTSEWSFRLRWIVACSIVIPTLFTMIFAAPFIPNKVRLFLEPIYVEWFFLLSISLHGLTSGFLQSRTLGWKRSRRLLWVLATMAGTASFMGLQLAFYPLQTAIGRTGAQIVIYSVVGIFQSMVLARKNVRSIMWVPSAAIGWFVAWRIREAMPFVHFPIPGNYGAYTAFLIILGGLIAGIAYGVLTVLSLEWILRREVAQDAVPIGSSELPS